MSGDRRRLLTRRRRNDAPVEEADRDRVVEATVARRVVAGVGPDLNTGRPRKRAGKRRQCLAGRQLWIVENFANRLVRVTLSPDLTSGAITSVITSTLFRVPTTVAKHGSRLALVNGRFDLGLPPPFGSGAPPGTDFDVVLVRA